MYQIVYTVDAIDDLAEIYLFYEMNHNYQLAMSIKSRILNHIQKLEFMPYRAKDSSHILDDSREFQIARLPYKAYLHIDEQEKIVEILAIVHTARLFPAS